MLDIVQYLTEDMFGHTCTVRFGPKSGYLSACGVTHKLLADRTIVQMALEETGRKLQRYIKTLSGILCDANDSTEVLMNFKKMSSFYYKSSISWDRIASCCSAGEARLIATWYMQLDSLWAADSVISGYMAYDYDRKSAEERSELVGQIKELLHLMEEALRNASSVPEIA